MAPSTVCHAVHNSSASAPSRSRCVSTSSTGAVDHRVDALGRLWTARGRFHRSCGYACGPFGECVDRLGPLSTFVHNTAVLLRSLYRRRPHARAPSRPRAEMRSRRFSWALNARQDAAARRLSPPSTAPMTTSAISLFSLNSLRERASGTGARQRYAQLDQHHIAIFTYTRPHWTNDSPGTYTHLNQTHSPWQRMRAMGMRPALPPESLARLRGVGRSMLAV